MSPLVVLVGPPGSGKTTVAALLARRLGVPDVDTDAVVESAAGASVVEIFARCGEPAFRELEHRAVALTLAACDGVVSLGGGAVLDARTRSALGSLVVVLLEVSWEHAAPRLGAPGSRPLLAGDVQERWTALAAHRAGLYAQVATATVATDAVAPDEVAAAVAAVVSATG